MLLIFQILCFLGFSFSSVQCIRVQDPNHLMQSLPVQLKIKTHQDNVSSQAAIDSCWKKVLIAVPKDLPKPSGVEVSAVPVSVLQVQTSTGQPAGYVSGVKTAVHAQGDPNLRFAQALQQQKIEQFFARSAHDLQFAKFDIDERSQMHAWKSNSWSAYLNLVPGLENPFSPEVKNPYQIFQLYSLYEFSGFRELLKQLPHYDQAMISIADRLDASNLHFDSALFEKLSDIKVENQFLALYFGQSALVKEARLKSVQEFKQDFAKEVIADQLKMITELEWNARNAQISIKQVEQKIDSLEKRFDATWQVQLIERSRLEREIQFLKDFNTLTKANLKHTESKLEIAKQHVIKWQDRFASTLSQLALTDLKNFEISLRKDLQLAHKECDKFLSEYAKWQCKYAVAVTQQEKNKIEVEGFRKSIINHDLAVSYYQALKEMHQYSQALVVAKENVESNYYKDRLNALQNLETQTLDKTLTAQGESFLKAKGIHVSELVKKDANILQRELRSELIELINQAALLCETRGIGSITGVIIHSVPKIAQASLQESGKGELAKAWMLSDLGNSMLDFVSTYADVVPNAPQQNETVKAVVEKVETAASYAQDVVVGAYKPLDELAQLSAKVLKVAEDVLVGQPIAKSLEDLKKVIDTVKKSMCSEQYKGDFSSIKELLKNEPVEIQQTYAELIERTRGITDDKVYEGQLFQVISSMQQGKHRGQELRNSSSHEWVQWVSKELSSLVLFETVLAQAEGFYYLAKGEYVGTKASIERGLSKEFLSKLEASEIVEVELAGTGEKVTISQKLDAPAYGVSKISGYCPLSAELKSLERQFNGIRTFNGKKISFSFEHIFEGEVYRNGDLGGFHHDLYKKFMTSNPNFVNVTATLPTGIYQAQIFHNGKWITKTFFPENWNRTKVMENVLEVYDKFSSEALNLSSTRWKIEGISSDNIKIRIIIDANAKIVTAYPVLI